MPDRSSDTEFQVLEIHIDPAKRKQLADPEAGCCVKKSQGAFPNGQLAEEKVQLREFKNFGHLLSLRALAYELDRIAIRPLVAHCVMKDGAHPIPDLRFRAASPLDAGQPFFNCDWFYLIELVISPTRQDPSLQVAFVSCSRRERLPSLSLTRQLLQPVMSDQFGNVSRSAFSLRGLLVSVDAQSFSCFEGRCLRCVGANSQAALLSSGRSR